jgi:hypothetical protein
MERWCAQRALLTRAGISTAKLSWLFGRPKNEFMRPLIGLWNDAIRDAPIRIHVGELPTTPGTSGAFRQRIDAELQFLSRNGIGSSRRSLCRSASRLLCGQVRRR